MVIPIDQIYLDIPSITTPIIPYLTWDRRNGFQSKRYAQDPSNGVVIINSSPDIILIATFLKPETPDKRLIRYSLEYNLERLKKQGLILDPKNIENNIENAYGRLRADVFSRLVLAELLDRQPEKRLPDYQLPQGKNAVLYRKWEPLKTEDRVDPKGLDPIPVKWQRTAGTITREMTRLLGAPSNTYVLVNKKYTKDELDGLCQLFWEFNFRTGPTLYSDKVRSFHRPSSGEVRCGSFLGRRTEDSLLTIEEKL